MVGAAYALWPADAPVANLVPSLPALSLPAVSNVAPSTEPAPDARIEPSFDIARVGPAGNVVLAGRAEPGAMVAVNDGDVTLGQARADARGEWVLTPDAPLAPGGRELSLSARSAAGLDVKGHDTVLLIVPAPTAAPSPVVALLVPPAGAPRALQGAPDAASKPGGKKLALNAVDYDEHGAIRFAGTAPPSAPVRVYVDNTAVGDAISDAQGYWTLTPQGAVAAGVHRLRVDQLTAAGRVFARVELPFQRTSVPPEQLASGRVVVQPGQNLWRLARRVYGTGVRYTVIYLANFDQIRDPRLIYPGQALALPAQSP